MGLIIVVSNDTTYKLIKKRYSYENLKKEGHLGWKADVINVPIEDNLNESNTFRINIGINGDTHQTLCKREKESDIPIVYQLRKPFINNPLIYLKE